MHLKRKKRGAATAAAAHLHLAEVVQVHAVVGRAKGEEVGGGRAKLDAANIGLGVDHRRGALLTDAPQLHRPIIAPRHKSRRVRLHLKSIRYNSGHALQVSMLCTQHSTLFERQTCIRERHSPKPKVRFTFDSHA